MSSLLFNTEGAERTIEDGGRILRIRIPLTIKKRGGRKEIVLPPYLPGDAAKLENTAMVIALARAHRWAHLLETGKVDSVAALARHVGVDPAYISRHLRLTLLAPDIVVAILDGREPSGLSLAKLAKDIPVVWGEQRETFGTGNP